MDDLSELLKMYTLQYNDLMCQIGKRYEEANQIRDKIYTVAEDMRRRSSLNETNQMSAHTFESVTDVSGNSFYPCAPATDVSDFESMYASVTDASGNSFYTRASGNAVNESRKSSQLKGTGIKYGSKEDIECSLNRIIKQLKDI